MPAEQYGQTFGQGVKYIKVNRYDSGGLDRSNYLGQLTDLIINYDDLGSINYNIVTTQEQDTYFVYGIETRNQSTSSVNFEVLDYSLSTRKNTTLVPAGSTVALANYNTVTSNPLGYFTASSGEYIFNNTPNVPITASFEAELKIDTGFADIDSNLKILINTPDGNTFLDLYDISSFNSTTYIPISGSVIIYPRPGSVIFNTVNIIENSIINVTIENIDPGGGNGGELTLRNFDLTFTQSISPFNGSSSLTIFNPEFIDWDYNDYNALFGNAEIPQFSTQFMDVDYTTNYTAPVNFDLIISGTADRAQVQDSNYSSKTWTNIRYDGSRSNSPDFNKLTTEGGYGVLPNVEQNQTYIAYFDGVGGTGPEIIGQTAYFIKYLIDEQGNIINPEPTNIGLINLVSNFELGKKAIVEGSTTTLNNLTGGPFNITGVGRISPILVTETGSGRLDYARTMSFVSSLGEDLTPNIEDYYFLRKRTSDGFVTNTNFADMSFATFINSGSGGSSESSTYTINTDTISGGTPIKFKTRLVARNESISNILEFTVRIISSTNNFSTFNVEAEDVFNLSSIGGNAVSCIVETPFKNFTAGTKFRVQHKQNLGQANNGDPLNIKIFGLESSGTNTYFTSQQIYQPDTIEIIGINSVTSSYWSIGEYLTGNNISVLTASRDFTSILSQDILQSQSQAMKDFNFSNPEILVSQIQVGDFIRFEYNKNYVHNIVDITNTTEGNLALKIVPPVISGSILDHFILYRIINDGTYVILDVEKRTSGTFPGIIQPEYISQTLKDNYNNIIQDLTQKGLIL